jgi:hypothetical protein
VKGPRQHSVLWRGDGLPCPHVRRLLRISRVPWRGVAQPNPLQELLAEVTELRTALTAATAGQPAAASAPHSPAGPSYPAAAGSPGSGPYGSGSGGWGAGRARPPGSAGLGGSWQADTGGGSGGGWPVGRAGSPGPRLAVLDRRQLEGQLAELQMRLAGAVASRQVGRLV